MNNSLTLDEELIRRLPLPLAQLYRRAHNAKTPLERHLTAFYLWEAGLKLLASVAVVEYAERPEHDPKLAERLQNLARPSLGHWWEFARLLLPVLAEVGDPAFQKARDLLLGRARDDMGHAAALDTALRQALEGKAAPRSTVRLAELFERLVQYRNRELGHGAAGRRPGDFYERMGEALLVGVAEVFGRLDVLAGRRLVHVGDVRRRPSGGWLVDRYELAGEAARRLESREVAEAGAAGLPRPERLYLEPPEGPPRPLHPLVVFEPEAGEALFLNARRGRRRTEYLSYTTGRVADRGDAGGERRELLARVLGVPVTDELADTWAERIQAEEPSDPGTESSGLAVGHVGEFELLGELGRGGMGVVYRAWQPSLGRQVALKCLLRSGDPKAEGRFAREIRALGRVEHPSLVKIFTSGADGDRWFYAMELVEGATLAAVCDKLQATTATGAVDLPTWHEALSTVCAAAREAERPLSGTKSDNPPACPAAPAPRGGRPYVRHMAGLVRQAAEAAHALHEAGVVHRDIKPGNIVVDADGSDAVLMDLGLAQLADDVEGRLTRTRQFVGTLRYASPEQVLSAGALDRRSDVYSLGATLWELLTLRPLYGATEQTPTAELMRRIQVNEPGRPRQHNPAVPADLEAVVLRCLEKDPARRYATAGEVAEELGRYLAGEPVRARRVRSWERGWKWVKRRPMAAGLVAATVLLVLGLVAGVVGLFYDGEVRAARQRAEQALHDARTEKENAEKARAEEGKQRGIAEEQRARAQGAEEEAKRQHQRAEKQLYYGLVQQALLAWKYESVPEAQRLLDRCRQDFRGWEYDYVHRLCIGSKLTCKGHTGVVFSVCFSPDGTRLASASGDQTLKVWDAQTGQELLSLRSQVAVNSVCFSPDGTRLASASYWDQTVKLWDAQTGQEVRSFKRLPRPNAPVGVTSICFSPDGKRLAIASLDRTVTVWEAQTGQEALTLKGHTASVNSVCFSPDGTRLASASGEPLLDKPGEVKVWDAKTGKETLSLPGHTGVVWSVCFSPDGTRLAGASLDRTVRVWNAQTGQEAPTLKGHTGEVFSVCFSPDGTRLASASQDGTVKVWDAKTGQEALSLKGHIGRVHSVCFSPDGTRLASASGDGTVKVWEEQTGQEALSLKGHTNGVWSVNFSPDSKRLASASHVWDKQKEQNRGEVKVWDVQTGQQLLALMGHTSWANSVCFSPDGTRLASASLDEAVKVWDAKTGKEALSLKGHTAPDRRGMAYMSDGRLLVDASDVDSVCFSPDGARLASASLDKSVKVWDAQTGRQTLSLKGNIGAVTGVCFSPDGTRLASASGGYDKEKQQVWGEVKVWDAQTGQEVLSLKGHTGEVFSVCFSPDGTRLASASGDGTVKVWDAQTGRETLSLQGHTAKVFSVCFNPDGTRLVSASGDQTVKVWDAQTGQEALTLKGHTREVIGVCFSPDGKRLASASEDGTAKVWDTMILQTKPTTRKDSEQAPH